MRFIAAAAELKLIIHVRTGFNATDETEGVTLHLCFFQRKPFKHELAAPVWLLRLFPVDSFVLRELRRATIHCHNQLPF